MDDPRRSPDPWPTASSLEAIERAVDAERSETEAQIKQLEERLHGIDRANVVASEEREKSAAALRDSLFRSIEEGDGRLREHIANQVAQLQAALTSAEALEMARITACNEAVADARRSIEENFNRAEARENRRFEALERLMNMQMLARDQAIEKADAANEKRFDSVNEFRAQLSDQATRFIPRELFEAKVEDLQRSINALTLAHTEQRGNRGGHDEHISQAQAASSQRSQMLAAMAGFLLVLVTLASIGVVIITSRP